MQSHAPFLTIGTRGSPLAMAQARMVRDQLCALHGVEEADIAIVPIKTSGDRIQDRPLSEAGGKGLFTKEIQEQLLDRRIDIAVHCVKDVASVLPGGLTLATYLEREDVRDAFISLIAESPAALPAGARVGTSSLRRAAQMRRHRPDLVVVPFRGNVQTRLDKLAEGLADATLLACAGLNRLGRPDVATAVLDPRDFPPAPAQGAIGIEIREDDSRAAALIAPLDHGPTRTAVLAERAFLRVLDGSCRTPIAALTKVFGDSLTLYGQVLSVDGTIVYEAELSGPADDPVALGEAVGEAVVNQAGPDFFAAFKP